MKLDDFLKCKKVKCVENYGRRLTVGKIYNILGIIVPLQEIRVENDTGANVEYDIYCFEPVIDSAENPLQGMKLTPEFEAVEPTFKVGDKVYFGLSKNIEEIERFLDCWDGIYAKSKSGNLCPLKTCCHVTPENYEMLYKLYLHIKFEAPPKPLTGSDLARAMVNKGWFIVDCYVSEISDEDALRFRNKRMQVTFFSYGFFTDGIKQFPFAIPFDSRTGEPLTESVLND